MEKLIFFTITLALMVRAFMIYFQNDKYIHEKIDGVTTIDGIAYLVKDADVNYVMYKLGCTCYSKIIKDTSFERLNEYEGILKFGGVAYSLNNMGNEGDMNIGATYRIKCVEQGSNVVMKVTFEKRDYKWCWPEGRELPNLVLNQAYHRFFKEQLKVEVIKKL